MAVLFNRQAIFGAPVAVNGPTKTIRNQREQLPGVDGARTYYLGENTRIFTVRGRLTDSTIAKLIDLIELGQSLMDGQLYQFQDSSGVKYENCLLNDFRPVGPREFSSAGFTQQIQATIEQVAR